MKGNNNIGERFLPIGSVVLLKNATKRVMITGFCCIRTDGEEGEKLYDYTGCLFPEGVVSSDQNLLFDHNQIDQVFNTGYVDDEVEGYLNALTETLKKAESNSKQKGTSIVDEMSQMEDIFKE